MFESNGHDLQVSYNRIPPNELFILGNTMKIDDLEVPLFQETSIYSGVNHGFVEKQSVANHIVGVTFPFRPHLCERFSQKDRRMATRKGHTTHIHQQ